MALAEVVAAAAFAAQRIARFDQREQIAGERAIASTGAQHCCGEARRRARGKHRAAEFGQASIADRVAPSRSSRFARAASAPEGGASSQRKLGRTPRGELERECGQFDLRDFRAPRRLEALALRPQPISDSGSDAARAAGALVGRRLRDRYGFQAREAGIRIEARLAREAGVDDGADAGQRDARFGDVRGEHDAARAR